MILMASVAAKEPKTAIQKINIYANPYCLEIQYKNEETFSVRKTYSSSAGLLDSLTSLDKSLERQMVKGILNVLIKIQEVKKSKTLYKISTDKSVHLLCSAYQERADLLIADLEDEDNPLTIINPWDIHKWAKKIENIEETYSFLKSALPHSAIELKKEPNDLALSSLYFKMYKMIKGELIKAEKAKKLPLILLGEIHRAPKAQFSLMMFLEIAANLGFKHFTLEMSSLQGTTGYYSNFTWARKRAEELNMNIHAVDKEHHNNDPDPKKRMDIRDEAMTKGFAEINGPIVGFVGKDHLKGLLKYLNIMTQYHVIAFDMCAEEMKGFEGSIEISLSDGITKIHFPDVFHDLDPAALESKAKRFAENSQKIYNLMTGKEKISENDLELVLYALGYPSNAMKTDRENFQLTINNLVETIAEISEMTDLQGNDIFRSDTIGAFYREFIRLLTKQNQEYQTRKESNKKHSTALFLSLPYYSVSSVNRKKDDTSKLQTTNKHETFDLD